MGRSPCCEKANTNKGAWSKEEDDRLIAHIRAHGEGCWRSLPKAAGLLRCGKSCRLRWINYLRPDLKRGNFTQQEDDLIIKLHSLVGNKWSLIAGKLVGRTDNEIKNYWNTHIRRKLLSRGVDPATHRPIKDAVSTISFGLGSTKQVEEGSEEKKETVCPDLNLELQISPPCQPVSSIANTAEGSTGSCISCNMDVKDCSCSSSSSVGVENDFIAGFGTTGVLDFRKWAVKY